MSEPRSAHQAMADIARFYEQIQTMDHFQVLGVDVDTSAADIRKKYVALARLWHADTFAGIELGEAASKLDEIFQRISEANHVLCDPTERAEYIILRKRQAAGLATDVHAILQGETKVDEGLAQLRSHQWSAAEASFQEAISLNPDDPLMWAHHAWAQYRANNGTQAAAQTARKELERAYETQPNLSEAYFYLGSIAFEHEELDVSMSWLRRCLKYNPKSVEAARILRLANSRKAKQASSGQGWLNKLLSWGKNS